MLDTDPPTAPERGMVLVVDDEPLVRRFVQQALSAAGIRTIAVGTVRETLKILVDRGGDIDLVLTDLYLGEGSGMDVLAAARVDAHDAVVVVMTGVATVSNAVEAMRGGAYDFLVKPFDHPEVLVRAVNRAIAWKRLTARNRYLEHQVSDLLPTHGIVGDSAPVRKMLALIDAIAPTESTVLITGESGTGKELVARAIHERSSRAKMPFLAVNCGALAESVLESELFGHARGAFTGAVTAHKGLFEAASGGTLLLDEIGEMPASIQVRLLRVIEQREVRPVGSNETRQVDVRILAATNRDLLAAQQTGTFREDLYYRLNVVSLEVAPLRDRASDIPTLVHHFMKLHGKRLKKTVDRIDPTALQILCAHTWPGNVRELQNAIERSVVLARPEGITVDVLPPSLAKVPTIDGAKQRPYTLPLAQALTAFERTYIEQVLCDAAGNVTDAARRASVDRSNFRRLLKRHAIDPLTFADTTGKSSVSVSGSK